MATPVSYEIRLYKDGHILTVVITVPAYEWPYYVAKNLYPGWQISISRKVS